ncbi:uncharacterized protein METZ01_LOCUS171794 [marine metagenome]|uniref:FAD dependent oxidoreductase domain-containing protein n=1 Tax=marine metagenome TaxID=408172 RepID=A0A382BYP7_9ZZZZ
MTAKKLSSSPATDFLVVGGGIVGLTIAREIALRRLGRVTVLEKEGGVGYHSSGRNSGVLHAGIYYGSDTLKARVCSQGSRMMQAYAEERNIPVRRSGKVIVATSSATVPQIDALLQRARANGIRAERISPEELLRIEPYAATRSYALHSPDTAVIDSRPVLRELEEELKRLGVTVRLDSQVVSVAVNRQVVSTNQKELSYGFLINAAGLHADRIAHQMGSGLRYDILPFKGLYRRLLEPASRRFRGSIYPAPDPSLPFLGVHITTGVYGEVLVGPTAIPAFGRENYRWVEGVHATEAIRMLRTLAVMLGHNRQGLRRLVLEEARRYRKGAFVRAVRKLAPSVSASDIGPITKVGLRAQLVDRHSMSLVMDFVLEEGPASLHVLNAISPAFTSSFALAQMIVDRIQKKRLTRSIDRASSTGPPP